MRVTSIGLDQVRSVHIGLEYRFQGRVFFAID